MTSPNPLFEYQEVTVAGADRPRLRRCSVRIPEGGITVITGPSGAGKTTLLRCCNRLTVPSEGTIDYRGVDVATIDPPTLRRDVGMVFQRPVAFPGSVADNLRAAVELGDDEVGELLDRVGLAQSFGTRRAAELSGGEAQRMCLARALTTNPSVLLADEPTASLDRDAVGVLEGLARQLADAGTSLLWVTHDRAQAQRLGDHQVALGLPEDGPGG
ncbi:MAG: ATP-binding cassette domain-containing protein [Microthrixaceae bacterium]